MVDHQQEPAGGGGQHGAQQRAPGEAEAGLDLGEGVLLRRRARRRRQARQVQLGEWRRPPGRRDLLAPPLRAPDIACAQHVVVLQQGRERPFQGRRPHSLAHLQQHRLVEMVRLRQIALEEPALDRRQRYRAGHRTSLLRSSRRGLRHPGQLRQGLVLEDLLRRQPQAPPPCTRHHLQAEDRVAAEIEKVVVRADPLQPEHLAPDPGERLLGPAVGSHQLSPARGRLWRRQAAAVHLAVDGQRQRGEAHERRRHHRLRQLRLQIGAQRAGDLLVCRHPGDQPLVAGRLFTRQHHGLAHRRVGPQHRLDLSQLDPEAADLHLVIDPAQILQLTCRGEPHQVPRAIQASPGNRSEGVRDEAGGGQRRTVEIAAGQPRASDAQLSRHPDRHQLQAAVHPVDAQVRDRLADEAPLHPGRVLRAQRAVGDVHGRLRDAVHVD